MTDAQDKAVAAAISRLPAQSTAQIRTVLANAKRRDAHELVVACEAELGLRGPVVLDQHQAVRADDQAKRAEGRALEDVVTMAFEEVPASDYEVKLLRIIAARPGASFAEIEEAYGKRDTGLAAGHLVYDRFGFFRHLLTGLPDQSSVLLVKEKVHGRMTWALRAEAETAFRRLGVLG